MTTVKTTILPPCTIEEANLTYVVMASQLKGDWIFVRHGERTTWEMPAGHIEPGETADQAAVRELFEEAGVINSHLEHLCDYSVTVRGETEYGRLYGARVVELQSSLEYEIEEILLTRKLPPELTYPEVQTSLFERAKAHF